MKINLLKLFSSILLLSCMITHSSNAQWVPVASPPSNFITNHTYGFGLDGKGYLVTGGNLSGQVNNRFMQYDPVTDEFTDLDNFPGAARGFAIGDTWDGKAYFGFGASNIAYDDLWVYDPATGWDQLASCPCNERTHPALVAHNGKVYVGLGGGQFGNLDDWWIYDIATDSWEVGARFPGAPRHHPYQFGMGDFIYVGLGHGASIYNELFRYDPATDTWDEVASLPGEGRVAGQQFAWDDKGYVLSGEGMDHLAMEEGEFWEYDPELDQWNELPPHPGTSRWAPASFVINDEVYLFNGEVYGFGPATSVSEAYKYDLTSVMSSTDNIDKNNLSISPNPASDFITINVKDSDNTSGNYRVFNILGKEMMNINLESGNEKIDISGFDNGVYILSSEDKRSTWQFVVSK